MIRRNSVFAVLCAAVALATISVQAAPIFYVSADEPATTPAMENKNDILPLTSGVLNIYANSDVRLSGVSLNLVKTGPGIRFTGANIPNPNTRWAFTATPTVSDTQVMQIDGAAIPGLTGNGVGAGSPEGMNVLIATVNYQAGALGTSNLELQVGGQGIADWEGNFPLVRFGDANGQQRRGDEFGMGGSVGSVTVLIPEPATLSLIGLAMLGVLGLARRRK